jgi:hypothetical protein
LFDELHYKLKKNENDPYVINLMVLFDFTAWAKSKTYNKKIADILKEKAG